MVSSIESSLWRKLIHGWIGAVFFSCIVNESVFLGSVLSRFIIVSCLTRENPRIVRGHWF